MLHTWPELSSHIPALAPGGLLRLSGQGKVVVSMILCQRFVHGQEGVWSSKVIDQ